MNAPIYTPRLHATGLEGIHGKDLNKIFRGENKISLTNRSWAMLEIDARRNEGEDVDFVGELSTLLSTVFPEDLEQILNETRDEIAKDEIRKILRFEQFNAEK